MRIQSCNSIAICALALGLTGCRVQSVLVMPTLAPYFYATAGQTLEWLPYDPKVIVYVVFDGKPPCEKSRYQIGPDPARCKVLKDHNGYFAYHFETPESDSRTGQTIYNAKSCAYCRLAIVSGNNTIAVSSNNVAPKKGSTGYLPFNVTCDANSKTAVVLDAPAGVQNGDLVSWVPVYPYKDLKVTAPNICSGGNGGVFTQNVVCTVNGTASTTYQYKLNLDQCDGSSSLTINPPTTVQ
jgi:hypothetical protein